MFDDKFATGPLSKSSSRSKGGALPPAKYQVVIINNDKSPTDFVKQVMIRVFTLNRNSVAKVMMQINKEGRAPYGIFPREIAETKALEVKKLASDNECLLECIIERIE